MIGWQFGIFPSQPPNWMVVDPSAAFLVVRSLNECALRSFLWKNPSAPSTNLQRIRRRTEVVCGRPAALLPRRRTRAGGAAGDRHDAHRGHAKSCSSRARSVFGRYGSELRSGSTRTAAASDSSGGGTPGAADIASDLELGWGTGDVTEEVRTQKPTARITARPEAR
jgi:hypothetical protein